MSMKEVFPMRDREGDLWRSAKVNRRRPSEGQLADLFVERHSREVRFDPSKPACWIFWNGEKWKCSDIHAQRLVREICREASEESGDPRIESNRWINAVLAIAKFDPKILVSRWPCHPDLEAAVDGWISERCTLGATAWMSRPAMMASAAPYGWDRFESDELTKALDGRGIMYRRKGNIHGFDGVTLRDDSDD
jgi:hypothetical protein